MRWVVIFKDSIEMLDIRRRFSDRHLDYLDANRAEILIGGRLRELPDTPYTGGLWIVEADSPSRIEELVRDDPYYYPEYRQYEIFAWGKVLEDRAITL